MQALAAQLAPARGRLGGGQASARLLALILAQPCQRTAERTDSGWLGGRAETKQQRVPVWVWLRAAARPRRNSAAGAMG